MIIFRIAIIGFLLFPFSGNSQINSSPDQSLKSSDGYITTDDGVQLYYRLLGSGSDTIIIIHGGPGFTMNYFLEDLTPLGRNHTLLFYDQRGSGKSTLVSDSVSLTAYRFAADLNAIRKHFAMNRLTLFGHSWGSGVVALYSSSYPERVARIIVVGVLPLEGHQLTDAFNKMAKSRDSSTLRKMRELRVKRMAHPEDKDACLAYYELWFQSFYADPSVAAKSKGDFCAGTAESRRNAMANIGRYTMASLGNWDWRMPLSKVSVPALIIHGSLDPLPEEGARAWATALSGSSLLLLENIGHFPYLESPTQFFQEIDQFLLKSRSNSE